MTTVDLISLIASIASLVLAVVAIWLAVVFYKLSTALSESTQEAAKGIGASVERLEKLFDKLYSDTFSMMRDTVSDMRKHIWPKDAAETEQLEVQAEIRADEKMGELRKTIAAELAAVLDRQRMTDEKLQSVRDEFGRLIERAMVGSRQVELEARGETVRDSILRVLRIQKRRKRTLTAIELLEMLGPPVSAGSMTTELMRLHDENLIWLSDREIGPDTKITLDHPSGFQKTLPLERS